MEELTTKLLELWDKIKDPNAYDWETILDTAIAWAPSAGLFLAGILLGRSFSKRNKERAFPPVDPEAAAALAAEKQARQRAELTEELRAEFDRKEAQLGGELASAQLIQEQQNSEMKALGDRLAALQEQLAEKQARVSKLARSLESAFSRPGNCAAVLRAQAPVVQLAETVNSEYQRIATGVARLERLDANLREQEVRLADCAGEVSQTRAQLDHKAQTAPEIAALTALMDRVDDQLRILHQNLRGCIQRCETAKTHLQSEKEKLFAAIRPISNAEEALTALDRDDAETGPEAIVGALDLAHAKLGEAKELLSGLDNEVDREIAEAAGRIEWLAKDSPTKFFAAVEELDADRTPESGGATTLATRARRRLGEVRGCLGAIQLALETGAVGTAAEGCGKARLQEAVAHAMADLDAARRAPAIEESPEAAGKLEELEKDIAARDEAVQGLKQQIEKDKAALEESAKERSRLESLLKEREEALEKLAKEPSGPERSRFIHSLLGIPAPAGAEKPAVPPAENLAEAKAALLSLKKAGAATSPDAGTAESETGAAAPAAVAEEPFTLTGICPGDKIPVADEELVVFRGDDPRIWDSDFNDGSGRMAIPLARTPQDIDYLRLRRLDNGDSIVLPIAREKLLAGGDTREPRGWCGKVERYFGGFHLGAFDDALPQEVVTKFGAGGWGFGHLQSAGAEQAYGWAGQKIEKTFFEISVGRRIAGSRSAPVRPSPAESPGNAIGVPAPGELSGRIPPEGLILFRGNDPAIWNRTVYRGANHRARAIAELPDEIAWIRLRRIDTAESVVLPVSKSGLTGDGGGKPAGFNGTNEIFYGARHLGAYDESCPQEIETRFTYGGWGFGHRPFTVGNKDSQACGWAGKEIAPGTVFEFAVFAARPALTPLDRLLTC